MSNSDPLADRWMVCLHEAGHVQADMALFTGHVHAALKPDGGGVANIRSTR